MGEIGDAYHGVRRRVNELVVDADDDAVAAIAPATPEWTARELLAHLAGVTADIVHGNLEGVGTDDWTARQVAARRDRSVEELLEEWNEHGPVVESMADQLGRSGAQLVTDASTHEHDIRGALGRPGARDSDAVEIAFHYVGDALGLDLDAAGHGALDVHHDGGTTTFGSGEPTFALRTTRFEFLRATTGRRSAAQVAAYDWDGVALSGLALARFTARADPLVE
jgi:uncharacterized protein (TIGR03083 family)